MWKDQNKEIVQCKDMNITNEGDKMPMGHTFDHKAKEIMPTGKIAASKAKKIKAGNKKPKPNLPLSNIERQPETWAEIFEDSINNLDGGFNVEDFMNKLTTDYYPPKKKVPYRLHK